MHNKSVDIALKSPKRLFNSSIICLSYFYSVTIVMDEEESLVYLHWSSIGGSSEKGRGQRGQQPQQSPLHSPHPGVLSVSSHTTLLLSSLFPPPFTHQPPPPTAELSKKILHSNRPGERDWVKLLVQQIGQDQYHQTGN